MYMYVSVKNDANAADTNEGMKGWGGERDTDLFCYSTYYDCN